MFPRQHLRLVTQIFLKLLYQIVKAILTGSFPSVIANIGFRHSAMIAASGSCATLAHIRHGHLHVANSGDGAAVLGFQFSKCHGITSSGVASPNGGVIARQLSRAHCIDNTDEVFHFFFF